MGAAAVTRARASFDERRIVETVLDTLSPRRDATCGGPAARQVTALAYRRRLTTRRSRSSSAMPPRALRSK